MQPESQATLEKGKNNAQKKVKKLYPHITSGYSVKIRQQHLEGKFSSQMRHLQAGVIKSPDGLANDRYSGLLFKVTAVDFSAAKANFHRPCYSVCYMKH